MKTNELTGVALDWAVAEAEYKTDPPTKSWVLEYHRTGQQTWPYSTAWEWGGPIIERERICITYPRWDGQATALKIVEEFDDRWEMHGPTPLIAAMRCFVASRLGDDVEIPTELQGETK